MPGAHEVPDSHKGGQTPGHVLSRCPASREMGRAGRTVNALGVQLIFSDQNEHRSLINANIVTEVGGGACEILPLTQVWVS